MFLGAHILEWEDDDGADGNVDAADGDNGDDGHGWDDGDDYW